MDGNRLQLSELAWTLLKSLQADPSNYLKDDVVQGQWDDGSRVALHELIDAGLVVETKAYRLTEKGISE
jgi:hypothetical protein